MKDKIFYTICFAFIITILFSNFYIKDPPGPFELLVGEKVEITGVVVEDPDVRANSQKLTVRVVEGDASTKVLVSTDTQKDFSYGDEVKVLGKLEKPENFMGDNGKEFDYINYLKKDGVFYTVGFAEVETLSSGHGSSLKRGLLKIKHTFLDKINYAIARPESTLMAGLILGERGEFSAEERDAFVRTGTIHIIALSGYNITIVAEWFMSVFVFLSIGWNMFLAALAIFLFVVMTGASSTAVRAGIMAGLVLLARYTGRTYDVGRAMLVTAVVMIALNPMILRYDVSFQLSFIATFAVVFLAPRMEKYFAWVPKRFGLRDVASITFSAYIFVLPFILYKMGNLSLVALPANFLVLPFIPATMMFGFITGALGFISPLAALVFGYITYLLLHYELWVINLLSSFSFASISMPNFPLWITVVAYAYFLFRIFGFKKWLV